jgi:hypothetical protein
MPTKPTTNTPSKQMTLTPTGDSTAALMAALELLPLLEDGLFRRDWDWDWDWDCI